MQEGRNLAVFAIVATVIFQVSKQQGFLDHYVDLTGLN